MAAPIEVGCAYLNPLDGQYYRAVGRTASGWQLAAPSRIRFICDVRADGQFAWSTLTELK